MQLRERYLERGPDPLSDEQMVALVLGTGRPGADALSVAGQLLRDVGGLAGLRCTEPAELSGTSGIGRARAIRLHASIELGRRTLQRETERRACPDAASAHALLAPGLVGRVDEELHGVFLDRRHCCIAQRMLTRGCHAFTIVDPRQIFRIAVKVGASAVILAHNHPSGNCTPSAADIDVTERVAAAGKVLGIPLLDHLVVTEHDWVSLAQRGHLPSQRGTGPLWTV